MSVKKKVLVEIVVPCYNEELSLPLFFSAYEKLVASSVGIDYNFAILIIDNGSKDRTLEVARNFMITNKSIRIIELSRNFGKEASLTAGLSHSIGELIIPIDADLQDPMEAIPLLLARWRQGDADVVLGKRVYLDGGTFRKFLSLSFGRVFSMMSETKLPIHVGEFRLMNRQVVDAFNKLPESERFVRGLFSWLGFKTVEVDFIRAPRISGKSKFSSLLLLRLAVNGLISFTLHPLRLASILGFAFSLLSIIGAIFLLFLYFTGRIFLQGYTSLAVGILILGSVQLLTIGILGEYVGKGLIESKRRPIFIVRKVYDQNG
jgi:glycosyltransferase involved in cell wall biosynthesis